MTDQTDRAARFRALHVPSDPLILYNVWDAGSAAAVARSGARAIATGSWSVAAAQGFADGEALPMALSVQIAARIVAAVDLPVTIDFEGGYAAEPEAVEANVRALLDVGAVGLNFEDQVVGGTGLYPAEAQAVRIAAARRACEGRAFLNARTDVFLKAGAGGDRAALLAEVLARGAAYAAAGADGFFVPGLADPEAIGAICRAVPLPVNVMASGADVDVAALAALGVARISFGPGPYRAMIAGLEAAAARYA